MSWKEMIKFQISVSLQTICGDYLLILVTNPQLLSCLTEILGCSAILKNQARSTLLPQMNI